MELKTTPAKKKKLSGDRKNRRRAQDQVLTTAEKSLNQTVSPNLSYRDYIPKGPFPKPSFR